MLDGDWSSDVCSSDLNQTARELKEPSVKVLSVASIFGEAIRRIHEETSISALFH
jgi:phosphoribosylpyrophosphate synthetase